MNNYLMTPIQVYIIQGLISLLVIVIGYILTKALSRIEKLEVRVNTCIASTDFNTFKSGDFKDQSEKIDKQRDKLEVAVAELYRHQDDKTDKLRNEIKDLGTSIQLQIGTTNELLIKLLAKNGNGRHIDGH